MITLLTIDHEFELGEFLRHRQHLLLVDLLIAADAWTARLLIIRCLAAVCCSLLVLVKTVLPETARVAHARNRVVHVHFARGAHRAVVVRASADFRRTSAWVACIV